MVLPETKSGQPQPDGSTAQRLSERIARLTAEIADGTIKDEQAAAAGWQKILNDTNTAIIRVGQFLGIPG